MAKRKKTSSEMTDAEYDQYLKTGEAPDVDDTPADKTARGAKKMAGHVEKAAGRAGKGAKKVAEHTEKAAERAKGGLRGVFEKRKKIEKALFGD